MAMSDRSGLSIPANEGGVDLRLRWLGTSLFLALVVVIWGAFLLGFWRGGDSLMGYMIIVVISLACAQMLYKTVMTTLSVRRFGEVRLQLHGVPRPGATLKAYIEMPPHAVLRTAAVKLVCSKVNWVRVDRHSRERHETEVWSREEPQVSVVPAGSTARLEFRFDIPSHLSGTTEPPVDEAQLKTDYFAWHLELRADVPGVDLMRTYMIPMEAAAAARSQT